MTLPLLEIFCMTFISVIIPSIQPKEVVSLHHQQNPELKYVTNNQSKLKFGCKYLGHSRITFEER